MKQFKLKMLILPVTFLLFTLHQDLFGQDSKKTLALGLNYARHGSGDMDGIMVNFDYNLNYSKKVSLVYNLGVTIHGQKAFPGTIENDPMIPEDLRTDVPQWVTAGLQLSTLLNYNLTAGYNNGLKIGLGPILRYQLNSYPNGYAYYAQGNPWFRQPFYVIQETDDNKFNLGYAIRLSYDFESKRDKFFGINVFLQNDTNADMIVGLGLKIGLKLKWTATNMRIGYMAGLTKIPLGGSNAIGQWFGQKEYNWAFVVTWNILSLPGIGNQADEAMNSSHILWTWIK